MDKSWRGSERAGMRISTPIEYERRIIELWDKNHVFESDPDPDKPKFFITFPYSYQNGPLHVGHGFTASRADACARYMRMKGFNVLFPWAWHWTGEAVAGTSERLRRGDESVMRMLREIDGVSEELIPRFVDPSFICRYYTDENREVVKVMGFSVDWRREFYTTDLHPYYSKFIRWQYLTLERQGRVVKGSHPVVWCPVCQSPTGDHDRLQGEGVSPEEFTLVLFELDGSYLAAATLRPETVFGATNVWVNPEATYSLCRAGGRRILVSREAAAKMREQMGGLEVEGEVAGSELVGKTCRAPLTGRTLPILPALFVEPTVGTGVVYSVPSHAPYDYAALLELGTNEELAARYGIDRERVRRIEPISIIETKGLPDHPAVELVREKGITSQKDERLAELTREVYAREFYEGVMKPSCGEFAGLPVARARDAVKERLISEGLGDILYDLPEKVVCRSGDECIVKIVHDQWFLNYSDEGWKDTVRGLIGEMRIYPESARQWFLNVVDWLRDWPCARKTGLGTPLPLDESWIVETLSDSTVYQALYTISLYLNRGDISPENLTHELLDYIFRGVGDVEEVCRASGARRDVVEAMKREFEYWYPVDLRVSAKELVPNHLTFYLFHHTALFSPEKWPRGVSVNGMVKVEGAKMSKSRGNFVPLKQAIALYGSDATRLNLLLSAEDMDDPDWRAKNAEDTGRAIENFLRIVRDYASGAVDDEYRDIDAWLEAVLDRTITDIDGYMGEMKTRSAASTALYLMMNHWRHYARRRGGRPGPASRRFMEAWIKMLSPFAPLAAEEAWRILGRDGFVALSQWPSPRPGVLDEYPLLREEVISRLVEDFRGIRDAYTGDASELHIYVAPRWMTRVVEAILGVGVFEALASPGRVIQSLARDKDVDARRLPRLVPRIAETLRDLKPRFSDAAIRRTVEEEELIYSSAADYLSRELGCRLKILRAGEASDDPLGKSRQATPLRPGIYLK